MDNTASTLKVYRPSRRKVILFNIIIFVAVFLVSVPLALLLAAVLNDGDLALLVFILPALAPVLLVTNISAIIKNYSVILSDTAITGNTVKRGKILKIKFHKKGFKLSEIDHEKTYLKGSLFKKLFLFSKSGERVLIDSTIFKLTDFKEILSRLNVST